MKRKMSNAAKLHLSNARHWHLGWTHNQMYLNTTNLAERSRERVNFNYHIAVRDAQIDCGRILTKVERRQIYSNVKKGIK